MERYAIYNKVICLKYNITLFKKLFCPQFAPILFVLSTSAMLILDQRTLQIKYRVPAAEIYRLSLSPYIDDVAVFHVRAVSPISGVL